MIAVVLAATAYLFSAEMGPGLASKRGHSGQAPRLRRGRTPARPLSPWIRPQKSRSLATARKADLDSSGKESRVNEGAYAAMTGATDPPLITIRGGFAARLLHEPRSKARSGSGAVLACAIQGHRCFIALQAFRKDMPSSSPGLRSRCSFDVRQ